jgi:hypothetical protein
MPDKITTAIHAAINKIEEKIAKLEDELKTAKAHLKHKEEILKMATISSEEKTPVN